MKVSRREATSRARRVLTARPAASAHAALTPVTQTLPHRELMGVDLTEDTGEAASRTTSRTAPPAGPLVRAPTATAGAAVAEASIMGVVATATASTMHVRVNASTITAQRPYRDQRATLATMNEGTPER